MFSVVIALYFSTLSIQLPLHYVFLIYVYSVVTALCVLSHVLSCVSIVALCMICCHSSMCFESGVVMCLYCSTMYDLLLQLYIFVDISDLHEFLSQVYSVYSIVIAISIFEPCVLYSDSFIYLLIQVSGMAQPVYIPH